MPRPAEIEVEECAAPNGSYSLSARLVKPDSPPPWRKRADAVAPAGQDLVRIGLMADVPDQPVARRVEDVVQRDGQLDDAKAGAEMPAGHRDGVDGLGAQFVGDLLELVFVKPAQIGGLLMVSRSGVDIVMIATTFSLAVRARPDQGDLL